MEIVKRSEREAVCPQPDTTVFEYPTKDAFISGAIATIKGRYPEKGYCINRAIKELVYVVSGTGQLIQRDRTVSFEAGDTLFLDHGEAFAWQGDMVLYMATAPKFDPKQHTTLD